MGRKKLEMKRIEDKNSRQVTFTKRRNGLIKKTRELSVLCDVDVALVVFSGRGRLYEFCNGKNSLTSILQRYQNCSKGEASVSTENYRFDCASLIKRSELLETVPSLHRHLEEPDSEELAVADLVQLEKELTAALTITRNRKNQLLTEYLNDLHEKESKLSQENELLVKEVDVVENNRNNVNEVLIGLNNLADGQQMNCPSTIGQLNLL